MWYEQLFHSLQSVTRKSDICILLVYHLLLFLQAPKQFSSSLLTSVHHSNDLQLLTNKDSNNLKIHV